MFSNIIYNKYCCNKWISFRFLAPCF